jgi:uncharacterized membrane protein YuzA (DUF378 family)
MINEGRRRGRATGRAFTGTGAVAGALSALAFVAIHDLLISDIWFSLVPMMVAGAVCGLCIGWTYGLLFAASSIGSWWRYNLTYVAMFAVLGGVSVLVFEPRTTMAALTAANEPPHELIGAALPMTVVFTVVSAAVVTALFGRRWSHFGAVLMTSTVLVVLLGLNVSVIGLVEIPRGSLYLVAEMFGLIVFLNVVFAVAFMALQWKRLTESRHAGAARRSSVAAAG